MAKLLQESSGIWNAKKKRVTVDTQSELHEMDINLIIVFLFYTKQEEKAV